MAVDGSSFTLKDYAYDATANTAIPAGGMPLPTNISELLAQDVTIFGFDKSIKVKLNKFLLMVLLLLQIYLDKKLLK